MIPCYNVNDRGRTFWKILPGSFVFNGSFKDPSEILQGFSKGLWIVWGSCPSRIPGRYSKDPARIHTRHSRLKLVKYRHVFNERGRSVITYLPLPSLVVMVRMVSPRSRPARSDVQFHQHVGYVVCSDDMHAQDRFHSGSKCCYWIMFDTWFKSSSMIGRVSLSASLCSLEGFDRRPCSFWLRITISIFRFKLAPLRSTADESPTPSGNRCVHFRWSSMQLARL